MNNGLGYTAQFVKSIDLFLKASESKALKFELKMRKLWSSANILHIVNGVAIYIGNIAYGFGLNYLVTFLKQLCVAFLSAREKFDREKNNGNKITNRQQNNCSI